MVGLSVGDTDSDGAKEGVTDGCGEMVGDTEMVGVAVGANSPYRNSHNKQGSKKSETGSEARMISKLMQ